MHVPSLWNIAEHAEHPLHHQHHQHHLCQLSEKAGKKERGLAPSLLTY